MKTEGTDVGATNDENHDWTPVIAIDRGGVERPKPTPPKSKRRAERSQPAMNIRPAELNWNKYIVACVNCKTRANLGMIAQRSKEGLMVGWVFCCKSCFDLIKDKEISIEFIKPGHSKEAE